MVLPRAPLSHRHIMIELAHEITRLRLIAVVGAQRIAPGRQIVPARPAGGFRVRRDDGHTRLHQIRPVVNGLRVALAHHQQNPRGIRHAVVGQLGLPIGGEQPRMVGDRVDIRLQREGDDIRLQPVDHRSRLGAGAAVRTADRQLLAGLRRPLRRERLVDGGIQLPRRIVGYVEQAGFSHGRASERQQGNRCGEQTAHLRLPQFE